MADTDDQIQNLGQLLDNLPGMVYQCRNVPAWTMQFASLGSTIISGYTPEELISGTPDWGDIIHPDDQAAVWQQVQSALQRDQAFEIQYRVLTRSNGTHWLWERGAAVTTDGDGSGGETLIEGFITDITALKEKQFALARAKAFANAIVGGAAEGIIIVDNHGQIESVNRAAEQIFGVKEADERGQPVRQRLSASSTTTVENDIRAFLASGHSPLFNAGRELQCLRSDDSAFAVHISVRQLAEGRDRRYALFLRDISQQKAQQDELRQKNETLSITFQSSPIGIATADSHWRILSTNPAFATMLGYRVDELIGRQFLEFTHPEDVGRSKLAATRALTTGPEHYYLRKRYLHRDGHVVHTALNVGVIHDPTGKPQFLVANVEDLTARMAAEKQLRDQQEQLVRLERLSLLGEMMAGVAHEINQPLTAISTYAQSALRFLNQDNPKLERLAVALAKLSDEARRAGAVVERIRGLSRQDSGQKERMDCNKSLALLKDLADTDAQAKEISIRFDCDPTLSPVWGDPIQIQQVMLNLIRNAVDAMTTVSLRHGNEILVRTSMHNESTVKMEVVDQGEGVQDDVAEELFRPFSTNKKTGLGLGLSISRSIITAHGGQLDFANNEQAGATFMVTLPTLEGEHSHE